MWGDVCFVNYFPLVVLQISNFIMVYTDNTRDYTVHRAFTLYLYEIIIVRMYLLKYILHVLL